MILDIFVLSMIFPLGCFPTCSRGFSLVSYRFFDVFHALSMGFQEKNLAMPGMDPDGDGVDPMELLKFIREQHKELSGRKAPKWDGWGVREFWLGFV